jgi:hypothetical protein
MQVERRIGAGKGRRWEKIAAEKNHYGIVGMTRGKKNCRGVPVFFLFLAHE